MPYGRASTRSALQHTDEADVTSPMPIPPHQDPNPQVDPTQVTMMEYVTTLISTLDRRFDTLHQDLKDSINQRFQDSDLRYQQRFDAQTKALDAALAAQKEAVQTALVAAEKATSKAEMASDKRFESVNEFRQTLSDQTNTFMPRSEGEARLSALYEKINDLKLTASASAGRSSGLNAGWGYLVAGIGLIVVVVNVVIALATRS